MGDAKHRNDNINTFFGSAGNLSYFGQIKSIFNGASSSATVSADIASLNFSRGFQVTGGTNIQAGSSGVTDVSAGTIPTLSASAAGQAVQNMLYGGTIYASALLPLSSYGADSTNSTDGFGFSVNLVGREGVDIRILRLVRVLMWLHHRPHGSVKIESYLQYNSINLSPGSSQVRGRNFRWGKLRL